MGHSIECVLSHNDGVCIGKTLSTCTLCFTLKMVGTSRYMSHLVH